MHRMHRLAASLGLALATTALFAPQASAALLHATDTSQFPDLSSGYVSGTLNYTHPSGSATSGALVISNTPYALALGSTPDRQFDVAGARNQLIVAQINTDGTLNSSSQNTYDLTGTVTVDGKTYSGELLKGTPMAFGSMNTAAAGNGGLPGTAMYDLDVKVTGGLLKDLFGTDTYIRLAAERWSTFNGSFTQDFSGGKVSSNIRGFSPPIASYAPVPEPTTLVVLIAAGGAGLFVRHRRKIRRDDLEVASA